MQVRLRREGIVKKCRLGFSWTTLIFGWWVPFFRLDLKWGLVMLVGALVMPSLWQGVTYEVDGFIIRFHLGLLLNIIMAFFYNAMYVADLLQAGFLPVDEKDEEALFAYRLYIEEGTIDGEV